MATASGAAQAQLPAPLHSGQPPRNQCNAQAAQALVGQPWDADTQARALAATGADVARMLRHGALITQEYMLGRVNIIIGADERIQRVHCG